MTGLYSLKPDEYTAKTILIILNNGLGHSLASEQSVTGCLLFSSVEQGKGSEAGQHKGDSARSELDTELPKFISSLSSC